MKQEMYDTWRCWWHELWDGIVFVFSLIFFFANAFIACRYGYGTIIRLRVLCLLIPRFGSCINFFGDLDPSRRRWRRVQ